MAWNKRNVIFAAGGQGGWMLTHAQVPTVLVKDAYVRVYFCTRPEAGVSLTTFFDLDPETLEHVRYVHEEPIVPLGKPGTFDEFGVMPSCVLEHDGRVLLYTTGWTRGMTVPYVNAVGLLVSEDGGITFERYSDGPLVGATLHEPYSAMSPYVLRQSDHWHMWYGSGIDWVRVSGEYEPRYVIKYARSEDGVNWTQTHHTCVPPKHSGEANTRPTVIFRDGVYHMWFCYRGSEDFRGGAGSYRMGYTRSTNGTDWVRDDDRAGIFPSATGWDSEMVAYPQVVDTSRGLTMFYNGNGFGESGIGYALWEGDEA